MGNELYHHGILGQKWGVRRFQNKDGSLTEAGKKRLEQKELKRDGGEYQKKETEFNKEMVIAKGDYKKAIEHMEVFTEQELDKVIERHNREVKMRDFSVNELAKEREQKLNERKDRYNKMNRIAGYVKSAAQITTDSINFYNNIAKAANTFADANMKIIKENNQSGDQKK